MANAVAWTDAIHFGQIEDRLVQMAAPARHPVAAR
jgi:hypothetical protein